MKQLAIAIRKYTKDNYKEIINCIKQAGFKNVFIEWYNDDFDLQKNIFDYVKEVGLNIIFAHLGYQNSNALWENGIEGDKEVQRYIEDIKICKANGIDLVIIHPTIGFYAPNPNNIGIKRIEQIVNYAEQLNVKVAFENVELSGYLEYIVDNINNENLGICFDSGHCNLFFDGEFDVDKFKNKVLAIHLHDNFKINDDHILPFDGTVDWNKVTSQIIDMNYDGYIVIESGYDKFYSTISIIEYYNKAYEAGQRLENLFEINKNK